jgi:NTE family protein
MFNQNKRPKIGLALRGASSRSVFYIGFLEVLEEQGVPIDYISAMSSSSIVAAAYACGTLQQLKEQALSLNKEVLFSMIEKSRSNNGIYNLDKVEEMLRLFTKDYRFEDTRPLMGFVAADLNKGEEVVLCMGDIARAIRITCTVPGVFEPVSWGNRTLVDGGIISVIPGKVAQAAGMDIVIGVDLRTANHIFSRPQIWAKKVISAIRSVLLIDQAAKLRHRLKDVLEQTGVWGHYSDSLDTQSDYPGVFSVLGRSIDLALEAERLPENQYPYQCDLMITPKMPTGTRWEQWIYLGMVDFNNSRKLYELGRQTAWEYVPKIWQMIVDWKDKQKQVDKTLVQLMDQANRE